MRGSGRQDPVAQSPSEFTGFSPAALRFLRDLATHNDRAWFAPRKHIYEKELLLPLRSLLSDTTEAMRRAKVPLGADPKRSAFRIYRDTRFSPDKRPYKTNLGAYLSYDGSHEAPGGLYVHIQPKQSFIVVAFHELDRPLLQRWRQAMARDPKSFRTMLRALERGGLHLTVEGHALKRMPRGFEPYADSPIAPYLRLTSFNASEVLTDADVMSPSLVDRMVSLAKRGKPLLEYGWSLE